MNESASASPASEEESSLKALQDILHNRISQRKREMDKATERAVTDKLWTEIETLQWVLGQSLNVRRKMEEPNEGRYY